MKPRLLFFSNLFPTAAEPYRGLDNATLLHGLARYFDIRVLSPRPMLPWKRGVFSPRPEDAPFQPRWAPAAYLPKLGGSVNHLLMAGSLRRPFEEIFRDFQPSIILSSWLFPDSCAALDLTRGRVPLVAIAQGSDVHQYLRMGARRRVILKLLPGAATVITRSRDLSNLLQNAGFPAGKLRTIYNGVDLEAFQPRDQALARRECGLPADARIFLFVGNFYPVKNPFLLIRAFSALQPSDPTAMLVMAGGGPLETACRKMVSRSGHPSRVLFAGRKLPAEIARLMNAADCLVLPSRNEGVPNVILEAFASGLPVLASRVGGIPEVLDEPFLGRLFPADDLAALVEAFRAQPAGPARETAAIREHGLRFSWEAATDACRDALMAALR